MIPDGLKRGHVLDALERIGWEGVPNRRRATRYCLEYEGRHFAPKYVISEACRAILPDGLPSEDFTGGQETNSTLRDLGFRVVACSCGGLGTRAPRVS